MIGLLFCELKRLTVARRFLLIGTAVAIAFLGNCARAFFLVWIAATQSPAAVAQWHDTVGYAILGAVFLGTMAAAWKLSAGGASAVSSVLEGRAPSRPTSGIGSRKSKVGSERSDAGALRPTSAVSSAEISRPQSKIKNQRS